MRYTKSLLFLTVQSILKFYWISKRTSNQLTYYTNINLYYSNEFFAIYTLPFALVNVYIFKGTITQYILHFLKC